MFGYPLGYNNIEYAINTQRRSNVTNAEKTFHNLYYHYLNSLHCTTYNYTNIYMHELH